MAENPDRKALKGYRAKPKVSQMSLAKRVHCGEQAEKIKKGLSHIVSANDAVDELQNADDDQESHKCVQQLRPLWRGLQIPVPDMG